ncbi:MAG: hypothetical protein IJQ12_06640 [Lachnospiraceae bacterium]|nr:hypothetical protein [Lachnospiraceae bacterium]
MEQSKTGAAGAVALTLGAAAVLSGCTTNAAGKEAAVSMQKPKVTVQAGATEEYQGVVGPTLKAVYVQSDADEKKYGPIMQDIMENGLDTERELQTGL